MIEPGQDEDVAAVGDPETPTPIEEIPDLDLDLADGDEDETEDPDEADDEADDSGEDDPDAA